MQQRGVPYINLSNDLDYKSLFGEKNPNESKQSRDAFNHLFSSYIVKYHMKKSSRYVRGGIRLLQRAKTRERTKSSQQHSPLRHASTKTIAEFKNSMLKRRGSKDGESMSKQVAPNKYLQVSNHFDKNLMYTMRSQLNATIVQD